MPKRGASKEKQMGKEVMTNFPEEGPINLLSPRYLAVAASLILVFAAFASLLTNNQATGQATSLDYWAAHAPRTNLVDQSGPPQISATRKVIPESFHCPAPPEKVLPPPQELADTANSHGCYNKNRYVAGYLLLPVCNVKVSVQAVNYPTRDNIISVQRCVRA